MLLHIALGLALAQDTGPEDTATPPPIVSGSQVPEGMYDDTVALLQGGEFVCTGVLIGPRTVLTTALCAPETSHVIIGSKDWTTAQGELIPANGWDIFDLYQEGGGMDLGLVLLSRSSAFEPRPIAGACSQESIVPGGQVVFAGFGALRANEVTPNTRLNSALGSIIELECTAEDGCDPDAPQRSELVGGGEGVGPCTGDEGSPAYLLTPYGEVLLGIASRPTLTATQECGDPHIYTRIDAYRGWIEDATDDELPFATCPGSPTLTIQPFDPVGSGGSGRSTYTVEDPDDDGGHSFTWAAQPAHGTIDILSGNRLLYRADPGYTGSDSFTLEVRDPDGNGATATAEIEIVNKGFLGCGCHSSPLGAGWMALALPLLAARRRRH